MKTFQTLLTLLTLLTLPPAAQASIEIRSIEAKNFNAGSTPMTAVKISYFSRPDPSQDPFRVDAGYDPSEFSKYQFYFGIALNYNNLAVPCHLQSTVGLSSSPFVGVPSQHCIAHRSSAIQGTLFQQFMSSNPGGTIQIVVNGYSNGTVCAFSGATGAGLGAYLVPGTTLCAAIAPPDPNCHIVEPIVLDHKTVTIPNTGEGLIAEKTVSLSCDLATNVTISDGSGTANNLKLGEGVISTVTLNGSAFPVTVSVKEGQSAPLQFKSSLFVAPSAQAGDYEKSMVATINYP